MTETKRSQVAFDKNHFLGNMMELRYPELIEKYIQRLIDFRNGRDNRLDFDKRSLEMVIEDNDLYISDFLSYVYSNPAGPEAQDLIAFWNFILPILRNYTDDLGTMNIVNKIGIFNDKVQLKVLNYLINHGRVQNNDFLAKIYTLIANNPQATVRDKTAAAKYLKNIDIIRDTVELLKQNLHQELNKDMPDADELRRISAQAYTLMDIYRINVSTDGVGSMSTESKEWEYYTIVRDEFNIEKIMVGGAKYVPQITQSLEERVAIAEKQLKEKDKEIKKLEQDVGYLDTSIYEEKSKLGSEKSKNAQLVKTMDEMQSQLESKDNFIKSLKMKVGAMKTGLFNSSAVKDLQEWIKKETQDER